MTTERKNEIWAMLPESKNKRYGGSYTRLYHCWASMKRRCYNPNDKRFSIYGGRGIVVCNEWIKSFENFREWALQNGWNEDKSRREQSIDRIDVNGNYCPTNCRFTDATIQARNKRSNRYIEFNGEIKTLQEWSEVTNIPHTTIRYRLRKGWDVTKALTTPVSDVQKAVIQYDKQGNFIAEYDTIKDAAMTTGINPSHIGDVASNMRKTAGKFVWKYKSQVKAI